MGIRFFCPNGHSLNVKAELAGKTGYCPKCQARMIIPTESSRQKGEHFQAGVSKTAKAVPLDPLPQANEVAELDSVESEAIDRQDSLSVPREQSASPVEKIIREAVDLGAAVSGENIRNSSFNGVSPSEALLDDPKVLWLVRTQDGQEYGPASGDVLRSWIRERRIGPQTYVWREGWDIWYRAEQVFPNLDLFFEKTPPSHSTPSAYQNDGLLSASRDLNHLNFSPNDQLTSRRKKASASLYIIAGLIVLSLALLIALIVILLKQ